MAVYDDQDTKQDKAGALEQRELDAALDIDGKSKAMHKELDALSADDDKLGKGYNDEGAGNEPADGKKKGFLRRRSTWIGIGTGGGLAAIIITGFTGLLPLRLMHVTSLLSEKYFSAGEKATSDIGETLLGRYLIQKVIPGMTGSCTSTKSIDCAAVESTKGNPVSQLFNTWRDYKLEYKLATKYGFEITKSGNGTEAVYKIRTQKTGDVDISRFVRGGFDGNLFLQLDSADRNTIRQIAREAFADETKFKQLYHYLKVGDLLNRKHGITRCLIACALRDSADEWKTANVDNRLNAGRALLINRILGSSHEYISLTLECAASGFNCANYDQTDSEGRRTTQAQRDIRARIIALSPYDRENLLKDLDSIERDGYTAVLLEKTLAKVLPQAAANTVAIGGTKAIPIVGWIDLGVSMARGATNAGPALKHLNYIMATGLMASQFTTYMTTVDEMKLGDTDASAFGGITSSLDGAEQSPLYGRLIEGQTTTSSAGLGDRCDTAYGTAPNGLMCNNEYAGSLPSTFLSGTLQVISAGMEACQNPLMQIAVPLGGGAGCNTAVLDVWSNTISKIFEAIGWVVGTVVQFFGQAAWNALPAEVKTAVTDYVVSIGKEMLSFFTTLFIVNPVADDMNGQNSFTLAAGGANVTANNTVKDYLGGEVVSNQQANEIRENYIAEQDQIFEDSSLYTRLFDASNNRSLVSNVALSMPTSTLSVKDTVASSLASPLAMLGSLFTSTIGGQAQAVDANDEFGILQYAIPEDHAVFNQSDYEQYWEDNDCSNPTQKKNWTEQNSYVDDTTQELVITKTNPCKFLEQSVSVLGGYMNEDILTADDMELMYGKTDTGPTTGSAAGPLDVGQLTSDTSSIACAPGTNDIGLGDGYINGQRIPVRLCAVTNFPSIADESIPGTELYIPGADYLTVVSSLASANVYAMAQAMINEGHSPVTSSHFRTMAAQERAKAIYGDGAATPGYSNHQSGVALDIINSSRTTIGTGDPMYTWLQNNAATYSYDVLTSPFEAWHWDPIGI